MRKSRVLMVCGIVLLAIGAVSTVADYVTVTIDSSPPVVASAIPENGKVYDYLAVINCFCSDPDTGIAWIHYSDSSPELIGETVSLNHKLTIGSDEMWESNSLEWPDEGSPYIDFPGVYTPGTYTFEFLVSNDNAEASLVTSHTGQYVIYGALEGTWFINNVPVTDPEQHLHFNSLTLSFKFVKTGGSTVVSTSVAWSGGDTGSVTLPETTVNTWAGSHTFSHGGYYVIELSASDGKTDVVMQVVGISFPDEPIAIRGPQVPFNVVCWLTGIIVISGGIVMNRQEKRRNRVGRMP